MPTALEAEFFMSCFEDDEAYHTVMFGGTAPDDGKLQSPFLQAQLSAVIGVMTTGYPTLGFPKP